MSRGDLRGGGVLLLDAADEFNHPKPPGRPRVRGVRQFAHYKGPAPGIRRPKTSEKSRPRCSCGCDRKLRAGQSAVASEACAKRVFALAQELLAAVQADAVAFAWRLP